MNLIEIAAIASLPVNIKDLQAAYKTNPKKGWMAMVPFEQDHLPLNYSLKGDLTTDGIYVGEFENTDDKGKIKKVKNFSLGMQLDETIVAAINDLNTLIATSLPDDYTIHNKLKDDVIYHNCKVKKNGKAFTFTSNTKLDPKKPNDAEIEREDTYTVRGQLKAYINLKEKKAGISFGIVHMDFERFN
jgi:hypothetical protein